MNKLQKIGGMAAIIEGITYIIGFAFGMTLLADYMAETMTRGETVAYIVDNEVLFYIWHLLIYLVNGVFLVVLVQALYDRLKDHSPILAQTAAAFGFIWAGFVIAAGMLIVVNMGTVIDLYQTNPAEAELAYETLSSIEKGIGGQIELVGGIWAVLISLAAFGNFPKALNYWGIIIGIAGILTVIPPLQPLAALFGLGFIIWFLWAGYVMMR